MFPKGFFNLGGQHKIWTSCSSLRAEKTLDFYRQHLLIADLFVTPVAVRSLELCTTLVFAFICPNDQARVMLFFLLLQRRCGIILWAAPSKQWQGKRWKLSPKPDGRGQRPTAGFKVCHNLKISQFQKPTFSVPSLSQSRWSLSDGLETMCWEVFKRQLRDFRLEISSDLQSSTPKCRRKVVLLPSKGTLATHKKLVMK